MVLLIYFILFGALYTFYRFVARGLYTGAVKSKNKDFAVLWILAPFTLLFAVGIVAQERWVRTWDHMGYYLGSVYTAKTHLSEPFIQWLRVIVTSINKDEYNNLICFLIAPFLRFFGVDIPTYTFVLGLVGLLPFAYLCGAAIQRFTKEAKAPYAVSALLCCVGLGFPVVYKPWLQGMADIVVLPVAAVAVLGGVKILDLFEERAPFNKKTLFWIGAIGLALFFMPILRRYMGIYTLAWFPSVGVGILVITLYKRLRLRVLIPYFFALLGMGLLLVAGWYFLFPGFFQNTFLKQYSDIYQAYRAESFSVDLAYLYVQFGPLAWVLAALGLIALALDAKQKATGIFLVTQLVLTLVGVWRIQSFGPQHYYMLMPAIVILVGTGLLVPYLVAKRFNLAKAGSAVSICLAAVFFLSAFILSPVGAQNFTLARVMQPLASRIDLYPRIRSDFGQLHAIAQDLKTLNPAGTYSVYVAGSGGDFNSEIFTNMFAPDFTQAIPGLVEPKLHANVDRRDAFPLGFLAAKWVVAPYPMQYHLAPKDQQLAAWVQQSVTESAGLGRYYKQLKSYPMQNGYEARIYERLQALPLQEVAASLAGLRGAYPDFPAMYALPPFNAIEEITATPGDGPYALAKFLNTDNLIDIHPGKTTASEIKLAIHEGKAYTVTPSFLNVCNNGSSVTLVYRINGTLADSATCTADMIQPKTLTLATNSVVTVRVYPGLKQDYCDHVQLSFMPQ